METKSIERLEYLRQALRDECISYGELTELQSLAEHIAPNDVELLEAAGVPEHALFEDEFDDENDLFLDWENLPTDVLAVLTKHQSNEDEMYTYNQCEALVKDLEAIGYTCDYGLDAIPYGLKKVS